MGLINPNNRITVDYSVTVRIQLLECQDGIKFELFASNFGAGPMIRGDCKDFCDGVKTNILSEIENIKKKENK